MSNTEVQFERSLILHRNSRWVLNFQETHTPNPEHRIGWGISSLNMLLTARCSHIVMLSEARGWTVLSTRLRNILSMILGRNLTGRPGVQQIHFLVGGCCRYAGVIS